ncbi:TPA: autotransporter assembly complex protein TamA [Legionella pneumophila]|uniref:autotransporter assembly complex protein TamA n=1 Tax=Legionella pneumophila TaxID=446 RepID=UPI0007780772|nr:POTRA domain-containing protein [Legionella pneumophila]HAT8916820.1 BamA/TamA family outer membrane protein [Legionella pneumophila subsp. pneumophila]HAU0828179.1 BamA/TamA family outer membrane protein [Legionella pneumophila]HBD7058108.1 BamA/TamA family outer membrane protein [Legionella pneumophila]HEM7040714.1 BamA/TamA family outer membrane protein [Legionella pneumophila]HEO1426279.1 BamA/TamA family outer membrane protein [Legionella pneumophila]
MNRFTYLIILIILCFPLFAQDKKAGLLEIDGIKGKVLANVETRLGELSQIKPLSQFTPTELQDQINKAIQPFGYFNAETSINNLNNKIIIKVQPGSQIRIASIKAMLTGEGAQNPLLRKTLKELPLHIGDPLFSEQYEKAKQNIINTAENMGYLHGVFKKAEILIDEHKKSAQITLIFDTGPQYYFGQVQFDPTYISPQLLHRFVPFDPGQPYATDQVLKLNDYLSNSGYFSSVLVKPQITDAQTVPVIVHLQPVPKYSYSFGLGYGTDTGVRGKAALHVIPVNRQGHKFNAVAQGSFRQNALQAQYVIPGKNPVTDQYALTGNFSNLNYNAGYSNATLLSLSQLHNVNQFQRALSLNALYESFHYSLQPNTDQFLLYPKANITFSKTKNLLFSPSGYNITFNALGANKAVLSHLNFGQLSLDAKAALTLDSLHLRLYGHTIQGITAINDINELPLSLALLLGGTDNLKAYSFNSIGPGKIITYGGFEIQKEFKKNWYLVGFYDAGDVYNPSVKNIQYDIGGGLMWVSPIGPIKVGLAQSVDNKMERIGHNPRLVISMGPDL